MFFFFFDDGEQRKGRFWCVRREGGGVLSVYGPVYGPDLPVLTYSDTGSEDTQSLPRGLRTAD